MGRNVKATKKLSTFAQGQIQSVLFLLPYLEHSSTISIIVQLGQSSRDFIMHASIDQVSTSTVVSTESETKDLESQDSDRDLDMNQ